LFAFLAGVALTSALVVLLWPLSPVAVLLALTVIYSVASIFLYRRLSVLRRDWKTFPDTFDQLKKDRECLEKCLA
jgi:uncharacterized membrane protein YqjE